MLLYMTAYLDNKEAYIQLILIVKFECWSLLVGIQSLCLNNYSLTQS